MNLLGNPYFQNVASDFISIIILIFAGTLAYRLSRRRRLLSFFGCTRNRKIRLYLSNLNIKFGGAMDSSGVPRSYEGSSTPGYELVFIPAMYNLFLAPVPGLSSQPGWWKYLALREVEIVTTPSPGSVQDIDSTATIITVGSVGYNTVSGEVERTFTPSVHLDPGGSIISPDRTQHNGTDYALLAKCYHSERKQWAFYVAGSTKIGTTSAFSYLILHWPELRKEFGDRSPFSVVIHIIDDDPARYEVVHRCRL